MEDDKKSETIDNKSPLDFYNNQSKEDSKN